MRSLRQGNLCARGKAFLSAYYSERKIADRSLFFLEDAKSVAPRDPWVRMAEVLYHQKALLDKKKAEELLNRLVDHPVVSSLCRYLLACMHLRQGEYENAGRLWEPLVQTFPAQENFRRVRDTISLMKESSYFSAEMAGGMMALGRAFMALKDYGMAEGLYREVLRKTPDRLSVEEKKIAYMDLGRILEMKGDKREASIAYRSALRLDPASVEARERLLALSPDGAEPSPSGGGEQGVHPPR